MRRLCNCSILLLLLIYVLYEDFFLFYQCKVVFSYRENILFKIVPMVNPDGVFLGNQR